MRACALLDSRAHQANMRAGFYGASWEIFISSLITSIVRARANRVRADFNQRMFIEGSLFTSESVIITLILLAPIIYRRFKNTHDE